MIRFLAVFLLFFAVSHAYAADKNKLTIQSGKKKNTFNIEIADDDVSRERGLMFRKSLAADSGMLFIFKYESNQNFWMKDTLIPLDIIFIKRDGRIGKIQNMANPKDLTLIPSAGPIVAALELKGGEAQKRGIKPGDKVLYPLFEKQADKSQLNPLPKSK